MVFKFSKEIKKQKGGQEEGAQPRAEATCPGKPSNSIASDPLTSVSRVSPETKHSGAPSANFPFASSWQLIFPSVWFQEMCVFFFVCFVDLPQLVLTAVDSVK